MAAQQTIAQVQTDDRNTNQFQSNVTSVLNPILGNPLLYGSLLTSVALASGDNTINTGLNRKLQGWFLVRQRAAASIYDKQDSNTTPQLTLVLNASTAVTVDLYVF
jgi:hypothetical protein